MFTPVFTRMGMRVSPEALSTVPNIIEAERKTIGIYKMNRYSPAFFCISVSARIQIGTRLAKGSTTAVIISPRLTATVTAWAEAFLACSCLPAPMFRAI